MNSLVIIIKGMLCGVANIIPGVSGGTFALILGIYERLIGSLKSLGPKTLKAVFQVLIPPVGMTRKKIMTDEIRRTDAIFIFWLGLGALISVVICARLMTFLLEQHREPTLGFFIGLIVPSVLVPYRMMERKSYREIIGCILGIAVIVSMTFLVQPIEEKNTDMLMMFLAGALSISAMILPGVSGSFVLMVIGEYKTVLNAVNDRDIVILSVFFAGCLVGLLSFVRLLDFLLKKAHCVTMSFLIGLIMGSMWVLWPFKEVSPEAKFITGINVLPAGLEPNVLWAGFLFIIGLICSIGLSRMDRTQVT